MNPRFTPCPACARHVKQDDCLCPFCGAKVSCAEPLPGGSGDRMSRSAMVAAGAVGVVLTAAGCTTPLYGAPPPPVDASAAAEQGDGGSASDAQDAGASHPNS